jgi:hypothetical protein
MSFVEKPSPADEPSSQRPRCDYTAPPLKPGKLIYILPPLKPGEPIYILPPPTGYETMTEHQRFLYACWSQETGRAKAALEPKKPP